MVSVMLGGVSEFQVVALRKRRVDLLILQIARLTD